ncbi:MAG: VCBS repeat-containing protein [Bacteroidota bacterium]
MIKFTFLLSFSLSITLMAQPLIGQVFDYNIIYTSSGDASNVHVVDIDTDGDVDILTSNGEFIYWFENLDGEGNFSRFTILKGISGETFLADFDQDGDTDLAAGQHWYENVGNVEFVRHEPRLLTNSNQEIHGVNDINEDGYPDLLVAVGSNLRWLRNNRSGGFEEAASLLNLPGSIASIKNFDFEGDADEDLLVNTSNGIVICLVEAGTITMLQAISEGVSEMVAFDLNNDGHADIVTANRSTGEIKWWLNNGSDQWLTGILLTDDYIGASNHALIPNITFGDIDNDADMDIAFPTNDPGYTWFENINGAFDANNAHPFNQTGLIKVSVLADLDGDGWLDLTGANDLVAWSKNTNGSFASPVTLGEDLGFNLDVPRFGGADIDNDGSDDLVLFSPNSREISYFKYQGTEDFGHYHQKVISKSSGESLHTLDVDQDGDLDVLTVDFSKIEWALNDGSGNFNEYLEVGELNYEIRSMDLADVDNDGDQDIIAATYALAQDDKETMDWFEDTGQGNYVRHTVADSIGFARAIRWIDVDIDGDLDIFMYNGSEGGIFWFENDGMANFSDRKLLIENVEVDMVSLEIADLDHDGDVDFMYSTAGYWEDSHCKVYLNNGNSVFTLVEYFEGQGGPYMVVWTDLADYDGDGDLDLLLCDTYFRWYLNDGTGHFDTVVNLFAATGFAGISGAFAHDFTSDGSPEPFVQYDESPSQFEQSTEIFWFKDAMGFEPEFGVDHFEVSCSDNGTPAFPGDDRIILRITMSYVPGNEFTVSGYGGFLYGNNEATGIYGEEMVINFPPGSAGTGDEQLYFDEVIVGGVNLLFTVPDPGTCSLTEPFFSVQLDSVGCDDHGTPSVSDDDFIRFSLYADSEFLGDAYEVTASSGTVEPSTGEYGISSVFWLNDGSAGNGDVEITVTDNLDNSNSQTFLIVDPGTCSPLIPSFNAELVDTVACNDNGTPEVINDDYLVFDLFAESEYLGDVYQVSVSQGTIIPSTGQYGTTSTFQLNAGSAGAGNVELHVMDSLDNDYFTTFQILDPGNCSATSTSNLSGQLVELLVGPNPFASEVIFTVKNAPDFEPLEILVCQIDGRNIAKLPIGQNKTAQLTFTADQPPGFYIYFLRESNTGMLLDSGKLVRSRGAK